MHTRPPLSIDTLGDAHWIERLPRLIVLNSAATWGRQPVLMIEAASQIQTFNAFVEVILDFLLSNCFLEGLKR